MNFIPVLLKIYQEISNKQVIANAISNAVSHLLSDPSGDRLANDYVLTMTEEELLIEQIRYSKGSSKPEVKEIKRLKRSQIRRMELEGDNKIVIETGEEKEQIHAYLLLFLILYYHKMTKFSRLVILKRRWYHESPSERGVLWKKIFMNC